MASVALLEKLCGIPGISGHEEQVRDFILQEIGNENPATITPLGSLIVKKKGRARPATSLMVVAHMDEVGMMVTHITQEGYLRFALIGGIEPVALCGKSVFVQGKIPGVIGIKPVHLTKKEEQDRPPALDTLYIDIGAANRQQAQTLVALGAPVTFPAFFSNAYGSIQGRALDDRAGCAILIEMIRGELAYDTTFVFSSQEEIGLRGSRTAAFTVAPQTAIIVETTTAADIPGVAEEKTVCSVGAGPVLSFMDRTTLYDRAYFELALHTAKEEHLPCQIKRAVAGGNDAGAVHVSRGGVRTLAISIPCRYLHSAVGLIAEEDFQNTEKLLRHMCKKIASSS